MKYAIEFEVQGETVYLAWYRFGRTHIVRYIQEAGKYNLPKARELMKKMKALGHTDARLVKSA